MCTHPLKLEAAQLFYAFIGMSLPKIYVHVAVRIHSSRYFLTGVRGTPTLVSASG